MEVDNCRFASSKESSNNTSKSILLTAFGETKTLALWVEDMRCIVQYSTCYYRLLRGRDAERALTTPPYLYHLLGQGTQNEA